MMEDWLLVAYLHSREFADDEQTQNGIKVTFHRNLHSAAFQLAAQIVMKVFQLFCRYSKIVCKKLYYKAQEEL